MNNDSDSVKHCLRPWFDVMRLARCSTTKYVLYYRRTLGQKIKEEGVDAVIKDLNAN